MLSKEFRLRNNRDFSSIYNNGYKVRGEFGMLVGRLGAKNSMGIVTNKKVGGAVVRNKVRRQIAAICNEIFTNNKVFIDGKDRFECEYIAFKLAGDFEKLKKELVSQMEFMAKKVGTVTEIRPSKNLVPSNPVSLTKNGIEEVSSSKSAVSSPAITPQKVESVVSTQPKTAPVTVQSVSNPIRTNSSVSSNRGRYQNSGQSSRSSRNYPSNTGHNGRSSTQRGPSKGNTTMMGGSFLGKTHENPVYSQNSSGSYTTRGKSGYGRRGKPSTPSISGHRFIGS